MIRVNGKRDFLVESFAPRFVVRVTQSADKTLRVIVSLIQQTFSKIWRIFLQNIYQPKRRKAKAFKHMRYQQGTIKFKKILQLGQIKKWQFFEKKP